MSILGPLKITDSYAVRQQAVKEVLVLGGVYRSEYPTDELFFAHLLSLVHKNNHLRLQKYMQFAVLMQLELCSQTAPQLLLREELILLSRPVLAELVRFSVNYANFALFSALIETGKFDLNAECTSCGFKGNALVLVAKHKRFFELALAKGMDLNRTVIDGNGNVFNSFEFCLLKKLHLEYEASEGSNND